MTTKYCSLQCLHCNSNHTVLNGHKKSGIQNYKCISCGKQFTERTKSLFSGMRFSEHTITSALMLKFRGRNSLREIKDIIKQLLDITVSHVSPYNWNMKFYQQLEVIHKKFRLQYSKIWHVDEMFIRVKGSTSKKKCSYLYIVEDSNSRIVTMYISHKRNVMAVKTVLRQALENPGFEPEIIISDEFRSYYVAIKKLMPKTKHIRTLQSKVCEIQTSHLEAVEQQNRTTEFNCQNVAACDARIQVS